MKAIWLRLFRDRCLLCCVAWAVCSGQAVALSPYDSGTTLSEARLGASLGAGSQWQSGLPNQNSTPTVATFRGSAQIGCTGVDFNGFLQTFSPSELITEMRNVVLGGAQSAVSNYLLMLSYANPSVASVLDMADKRYSARYNAFSQACQAQQARAQGQNHGNKAMAEASDECFAQAIDEGMSPTEAYRNCSVTHRFGSMPLPAAASTIDFLKRYSSINVTGQLELLLGLLPDQRIEQGTYQMRPPIQTLATLSARIQQQTQRALDQIDAGQKPASVPDCTSAMLSAPSNQPGGCLPLNARSLVTSPAFAASRQLTPAARAVFKDALASQVAVSSLYSSILDLYEQISRIDSNTDAAADAAHTVGRRQQLQHDVSQLAQQADLQVKAQEARASVVRSQLQALEELGQNLERKQINNPNRDSSPGFTSMLRLFSSAR